MSSSKITDNDEWKTLLTVSLSEVSKTSKGYQKFIVLKEYLKSADEENPLILADIRAFSNGKPAKVGVCLTQYEFNWLSENLLYPKSETQILQSKSSTRSLSIERRPRNIRVTLLQRVENRTRRLNLYKREITKILHNYGDFTYLLEEMEEKSYDDETEEEIVIPDLPKKNLSDTTSDLLY
jgi:hypothetical protein